MHLLKHIARLAAVPAAVVAVNVGAADPLPPDTTYRPLPTQPFSDVKRMDEAQKPKVMQRQSALLGQRYDLANRPVPGVMMSGAERPCRAAFGCGCATAPAGTGWQR